MTSGESVQAIINTSSRKLFVLVTTEPDGKMTIINPEGKKLTVPPGLFEDPEAVDREEFGARFTPDQVTAIDKYISKRKKKTTRKKKVTKKKATGKTGVGAKWTADQLTFYKHRVDPLEETESMEITLSDGRVFEINKLEFEKHFSDVIISKEFSEEGSFSYDEVPEKAEVFLK